jgi:hypothetical protein
MRPSLDDPEQRLFTDRPVADRLVTNLLAFQSPDILQMAALTIYLLYPLGRSENSFRKLSVANARPSPTYFDHEVCEGHVLLHVDRAF